ncbi:MAG: hypothetical protein ACE5H8_13280 [Alphaproteobacteria bacterium]
MTAPLVCILGGGDWRETNRAIASARRFGLEVAVGVASEITQSAPHPEARLYPLEWRHDFAEARNRLAAQLADEAHPGDYLLWLDSDEELATYPADNPDFEGPCLAVRIVDRGDLTPRAIVRLQRRTPFARWVNAIHETPWTEGPEPPIVESILIRHYGYDDAERVAAKCARNLAIVARERAKGRDYYALALEEARAIPDAAAFLAWLRAFKHPEAAPCEPGGYDARHEPAAALCAFDYRKPALEVLATNPRILNLQLAVLASELRSEGAADPDRLAYVDKLIATGGNDPRYAYPQTIKDADRAALRAWLEAAGADGQKETGT